jgi:hypothetical protein
LAENPSVPGQSDELVFSVQKEARHRLNKYILKKGFPTKEVWISCFFFLVAVIIAYNFPPSSQDWANIVISAWISLMLNTLFLKDFTQ